MKTLSIISNGYLCNTTLAKCSDGYLCYIEDEEVIIPGLTDTGSNKYTEDMYLNTLNNEDNEILLIIKLWTQIQN